jgi:hypothetical protein
LIETGLDNGHRMVIDERRGRTFDGGIVLVHLDMDWAQVGVITVLMPAQQEPTNRLDSVEPVAVSPGFPHKSEPHLDSCGSNWIQVVIEESSRVGFCRHSIGPLLPGTSDPQLERPEISGRLKAILAPVE